MENSKISYLALLRVASHMRQNNLAEKLGISASYLSMIEKGQREPSLTLLRKTADVLQVPITILLYDPKDKPESEDLLVQEDWKHVVELQTKIIKDRMHMYPVTTTMRV